jgi:hypothetical protein
MTTTGVPLKRSWVTPLLVAATVAALLIAAFLGMDRYRSSHEQTASRTWPSDLTGSARKQLARHMWVVRPSTDTALLASSDEQAVVNAAVSSFDFTNAGQVQSVTLMNVTDERTDKDGEAVAATSQPMWVVQLQGVTQPVLGGSGEQSVPGSMVIMVDPNTMKAVSGLAW